MLSVNEIKWYNKLHWLMKMSIFAEKCSLWKVKGLVICYDHIIVRKMSILLYIYQSFFTITWKIKSKTIHSSDCFNKFQAKINNQRSRNKYTATIFVRSFKIKGCFACAFRRLVNNRFVRELVFCLFLNTL